MPNTLTNVLPKILARGLQALSRKLVMPRLVNSDWSTEAAEKGDVINVPIPASQTAVAVVPAAVPPTPADTTPATVAINLDQWFKTDFHLTDKEMVEIDRSRDFIPMQTGEAIKALATQVNTHILSKYTSIFGYFEDATPGDDIVHAIEMRKVLNEQEAPSFDRRMVVDFATEARALALPAFRDVSQSSDRGVIIEGEIGKKLGFDWFAGHDIPTHTKGGASGYLTNGAPTLGSKAIVVDTGTGTFVLGDIITFAGDLQTYVITAAHSGGAGTLAISPGLKVAVGDGAALSIKGNHVVNLAFHRDAWAFATRPLAVTAADLALGNQILSASDPQTGIVLRLEVSRQYKQVLWEFDILWGSEIVRPELAARLADVA